ncbi:MAG: cellulase family glycosylhydrolase [Mollicutes bacterium]|nr:cellulase family glycosylhydrolase [Mollicutes bacterium]
MKMGKWSKEKAKQWYSKYPWIRGFNYVPSTANHRIEFYQEWGWENQKETIERELALAHSWGFNAIRILMQLEIYIDQHDSYMSHIEEILEIAHKNSIYVMICFGNDCVVQKQNYSWPEYGPQSFDFGYHGGRKKSPHVVMDAPGYNLIDEKPYEEKFYEMIKEIITKHKDDERVLLWDMYNEPGNSRRGMMSFPYLEKAFEVAREINPSQPLTACCWSYDEATLKPYKEIEIKALEMSDVISYHCYLKSPDCMKVSQYLMDTYDRPMFNTEWLHRIWHNDVFDLFPYFKKENIGCFNWGFVTGKQQTREPWEWLWNAYDKGKGKDWDFTKWQHDLVRPNLRPYDPKEYDVIKEVTTEADKEWEEKNK